MVPSDPLNSPLPDRHARSKHGSQRIGDAALAPVTAFYPATDQYARAHPLFLPARSFRLGTVLLACSDCSLSSRTTAARIKLPDSSLRRNSELFFQPVRPSAPTLDGVHHASGDVRRTKPVAVSRAQNSQTSNQPSLPFRTFVPPDRSAQSAAWSGKAYLGAQPVFPSLPKASITFNNYPLPDHRSRFVTVHSQAYCSSRTSWNHVHDALKRFVVNKKCKTWDNFQRFYQACFLSFAGISLWTKCG